MAERSRKSDGNRTSIDKPLTIGLWRDLIQGSTELDLDRNSDAMIFTISSNFEKEYTLDGRCDGGVSSVFRMDSMKPTQVKFDLKKESDTCGEDGADVKNVDPIADNGGTNDTSTSGIGFKNRKEMSQNNNFGNWHDIRSLSAVTFAVDSLVDLFMLGDEANTKHSSRLITQLFETNIAKFRGVYNGLNQNITKAWATPAKVGTAIGRETGSEMFENSAVIKSIKIIVENFLQQMDADSTSTIPARYLTLIKVCGNNSEDSRYNNSTLHTVRLIFLNNMQAKIAAMREMKKIMGNGDYSDVFAQVSKKLLESIRDMCFE